jgi:hypothetical protein
VYFDLGNRRTDRTTLNNPGTVEITVDKLDTEFPPDVRFVAVGADGTTDIGDSIEFDTQPPDGELVTIGSPSLVAVDETTATLEASVVNRANIVNVDVGFGYGPAGGPLTQFVDAGSSKLGLDATVSGLDPGTEYEFRAVGEGINDSDATAVRSFSTLSSPTSKPPEPPEPTNPPTIDELRLASRTGYYTLVRLNWAVSDEDGDLSTVTAELLAGDSVLDSFERDVGSGSASGRNYLFSFSGGSTVEITVTDEAGNTTTTTERL